jgi:homocysteine S-methyltransferase
MPTAPLLHDRFPLLLDGGLSNVLEAQGYDLRHPLWTARLLAEHPEAIVQAHLAYLDAGAQCITTASYQASIPGFIRLGYSRATAEQLLVQSVALAEQAIAQMRESDSTDHQPLIAASVGPYGAYLADGSEYQGNYGVADAVLHTFHRERITILAQTPADILACETIPSQQEARVLADLLATVPTPAWVSFACRDAQHLHDGSRLTEAAAIFRGHPTVFAVGANCTAPRYIAGIIRSLQAAAIDQRIIVYPNSGEVYHAESKRWLGLAQAPACGAMAQSWLAKGADIIGGCCRIGPAQIREMRRVLG